MDEDLVPGSGVVASQLQTLVEPALRKKREGRGTHCIDDVSKIEAWTTRPPSLE
jgi:hypothetical protein